MSTRSPLVRSLPCIACEFERVPQPSRTTEHHLNCFGRAGQKRRGDAYSIPLCEWHHQGYPPAGMTTTQAGAKFGPSLARQSKAFRARYGSDDQLLERTNNRLRIAA